MPKAFVIFDRDGTLIDHVHHLASQDQVKFKVDLITALIKLRDGGFKFGVISNQSIINRGIASKETVEGINGFILERLAKSEIEIEFVFLCPHLPEDNCGCRKPGTQLGQKAILEHDLSPPLSYVVGDQESDVIFGKNLGCTAIQVKGDAEKSAITDYYSNSLSDAADWILARPR
jgi:histidinol-phosphate phosphatase family protein